MTKTLNELAKTLNELAWYLSTKVKDLCGICYAV